jgi:maleylacetoacetate isomerase
MNKLTLYHYWRSTSSWRVRWAMDYKGVKADLVAVNILENQTESPEHLKRNPMGYVPVLEIPTARKPVYLSESLAIIQWFEQTEPRHPLIPEHPISRARAWQLTELVNSGIQPLQNTGVAEKFSDDPEKRKAWQVFWITKGLTAYEALVQETAGKFSIGDSFTLADLVLGPQLYAAARNEIDTGQFPSISRIHGNLILMESYQSSHPDRYAPKAV